MKLPPGVPESQNVVYYRLYNGREVGGDVVCLQNFDEGDYREDSWLSEDRYTDRLEAKEALRLLNAKDPNVPFLQRAARRAVYVRRNGEESVEAQSVIVDLCLALGEDPSCYPGEP